MASTVSYKMLKFSCQCGNVPSGVQVGTTSDYNFLARWTCAACGQEVMAFMSLEKLISGVPPPPNRPAEFNELDKGFLEGLHIKLGEGI